MSEHDILKFLPKERQLDVLDNRLIQLLEEKKGAEHNPYWRGRYVKEIERDIQDVEFRRRILIERLSVGSKPSPSKNGIIFEVKGDMTNHGVIQTSEDAIVGVSVMGNYSSGKDTKIIQGNVSPRKKENTFLVVITLFIAIISIPWWPNFFEYLKNQDTSKQVSEETIATSTSNISDIFENYKTLNSPEDKINFNKEYKNTRIYGSGYFSNKNELKGVSFFTIDVLGGRVKCTSITSNDLEIALKAMEDSPQRQKLNFFGVLNSISNLPAGNELVLTNCKLLP